MSNTERNKALEEAAKVCDSLRSEYENDGALFAAFNVAAEQIRALASPVAQPQDEREAQLVEALKFYAEGHHFVQHDPSAWDTVSGEPINFQEDEACTATVEDGSIAKLALQKLPDVRAATSQDAVDADLIEIARTICAVAAHARDHGRHEYDPSPLSEGSPLLIAAREACLKRGFTADGLSVDIAAMQAQGAKE